MIVSKNNSKVISLSEVISIMLLVGLVLFIFFPKDRIKEYVAKEESNYDLTLTYLKNIAYSNPDEAKNWERIIQLLLKMQKFKEAEDIFDKHLITHKDKRFLKAKIKKSRYFAKKDTYKAKEYLKDYKDELRALLNLRDVKLWNMVLREAYSLDDSKLIFDAMRKIYSVKREVSKNEFDNIHNLAIGAKRVPEYIEFLKKLYKKKHSKIIANKLIKIYSDLQRFDEVARIYEGLYRKNYDEKLFLKTMKYYLLSKDKKALFSFVSKYEDRYLDNVDVSLKIMRLYISNGYLDDAKRYTLKQMKERGEL